MELAFFAMLWVSSTGAHYAPMSAATCEALRRPRAVTWAFKKLPLVECLPYRLVIRRSDLR